MVILLFLFTVLAFLAGDGILQWKIASRRDIQ